MKKIPNMISTKDMAYIDDMFNWNMIVTKKLTLYLDEVCDEDVKEAFIHLRDIHLKHCNTLSKMLKGDS